MLYIKKGIEFPTDSIEIANKLIFNKDSQNKQPNLYGMLRFVESRYRITKMPIINGKGPIRLVGVCYTVDKDLEGKIFNIDIVEDRNINIGTYKTEQPSNLFGMFSDANSDIAINVFKTLVRDESLVGVPNDFKGQSFEMKKHTFLLKENPVLKDYGSLERK